VLIIRPTCAVLITRRAASLLHCWTFQRMHNFIKLKNKKLTSFKIKTDKWSVKAVRRRKAKNDCSIFIEHFHRMLFLLYTSQSVSQFSCSGSLTVAGYSISLYDIWGPNIDTKCCHFDHKVLQLWHIFCLCCKLKIKTRLKDVEGKDLLKWRTGSMRELSEHRRCHN